MCLSWIWLLWFTVVLIFFFEFGGILKLVFGFYGNLCFAEFLEYELSLILDQLDFYSYVIWVFSIDIKVSDSGFGESWIVRFFGEPWMREFVNLIFFYIFLSVLICYWFYFRGGWGERVRTCLRQHSLNKV